MTATTRIVTGHFEHADGSDWAGGTLAYQLMSWSYLSGSVMPSDTITDTADEDGDSATTLWTNTEGQTPTVYTVTLPDGSQAEFILPPGETPISLPELFDLYEALTEWYTGDLDALFDARDAAIYAAFANTSDTALGDFLVGFRQVLTGAVGRTVHAKLGDTYHVADWGVTTTAAPVLISTVFDTLEDAQAMYPATTAETFETQTVYYANDVGVQAAIDALATAGGHTLYWGAGDYHFSRRFETKHKVRHQGNGTVWDFDSAPDSAYDEDGVLISSGFVAAGDVDFASCVAAIGDDPVLLPALADDVDINALELVFESAVPAEVVPGSILPIYNDSDYSLTHHRPQYRAGEMVIVELVSDDRLTVTLGKATYAAYAAADVDVYLMTPIEVDIRDITIKCKTEPTRLVDDVVTQVTSPIGLYIKYGSGTLSRVSLSGTNWSHIGLQTCFDFELDSITIDYYSVAIGLNYGISLWNSQRIEVKGGNCRVARHALNFGGSGEIGIPYRDIVVTGGIWDGAGEGSLGCIGMHGNGGHVQFNGCKILNSIAAAGGDITMDGCTIRSGPSGILVYAAEMTNANYTIRNCTLHVMSSLLSANDAVVGAINLVYQPDCVGGLTVLENIRIDMGGYSGYPIRLFHNGCEGHVDITKRGIDVVNVHPTANTVHFLLTGIAGAVYRRFELDNINLDRAEIRFDGTGAALIRLNNVRGYDAPTIPVYITPNPSTDAIKLVEVEVDGEWTTLKHVLDPEDEDGTDPDLETFTLANVGDKIYFSYPEPFKSITLDLLTNFNTAVATMTWQYATDAGTWDEETGLWSEGNWTNLSGVTDGTISSGHPLGQDGTISWTVPEDWVKRRIGLDRRGASRLYFVRGVVSVNPLTIVRLHGTTIALDTPVTEELIEVIGCHLRGAQGTGLQIEGTQAFTQIKVSGCDLTNNGANPAGSSSAKASFYVKNAALLEVETTWVGDSRAPSTTSEAQLRLWVVDRVNTFIEHDNPNINPGGLNVVTETNITNRYTSMDSGWRVEANATAAPTKGTWPANARIKCTATPTTTKKLDHWNVFDAGSFGPLGVVTGTSAGGTSLTVSSVSSLQIGDWITVVGDGLTSAGAQITNIVGLVLTLSASISAVTNAAVSYAIAATTLADDPLVTVNRVGPLLPGDYVTIAGAGILAAGSQITKIDGLTLRLNPAPTIAVTAIALTYKAATFTVIGRGRGSTASRPTLTAAETDFIYWDTNLGKLISWNGSGWDV